MIRPPVGTSGKTSSLGKARFSSLVAFALLCCGCLPRLGAFCNDDGDCSPELRCTGNANTRGICVYREVLPNATADARANDLANDLAVDSGADLVPDQTAPDLGGDVDRDLVQDLAPTLDIQPDVADIGSDDLGDAADIPNVTDTVVDNSGTDATTLD